MKVLRHIISTGELKVMEYPRFDLKPVKGLDSDVEFYFIRDSKPVGNYAQAGYQLTTELHDHFKIADVKYELQPEQEPIEDDRLKKIEDDIKLIKEQLKIK